MTRAAKKSLEKRGVGRPRYRATDESRMKVTMLLACGMPVFDVALALDIGEQTLRRAYAAELRTGPAKRRAEVIEMMFATARSGNAAMIKHLESITAVSQAEDTFKAAADEAAPRAPRLGKKAQRAIDALKAGADTEWAGDLGPILDQPDQPKTAH